MKSVWMVRAGRGGQNVDEFFTHKLVAIGAERLGPLPAAITKHDLLQLHADKYPEDREGTRLTFVGQLYRFLHEIRPGDLVITYDREQRAYLWGEVVSGYEWRPELLTVRRTSGE